MLFDRFSRVGQQARSLRQFFWGVAQAKRRRKLLSGQRYARRAAIRATSSGESCGPCGVLSSLTEP